MIASAIICAALIFGFALARALSARLGHPPWASPVLVTALAAAGVLAASDASIDGFETAAYPLRWLLAPALVGLATVIAANWALLRSEAAPILIAVTGGTIIGIASALGLARLFGLDRQLQQALAVKTVTTPFAVAIMTQLDGPVALAAALAVLTGVIGAILVPATFDRLGIRTAVGRALGVGVSSHLVGTDWLARRDSRGGGLSALAFVLAGLVASVVVPLFWRLLA